MKRERNYLKRMMLGVVALGIFAVQTVAAQGLPDWSTLFEENKAAVVSITTEGKEKIRVRSPFDGFPFGDNSPFGSPFGDDPFSFFFGERPNKPQERERTFRSAGSGFIIDEEGLVITNAHVVDKADDITVHLADRREVKAELIGKDEKTDVAVLRVKAKDLPTVKIADVTKLKVGQWVMAVGSPFGLDYTATQGIISSLGRNLPNDNYTPFIQTDAAVNPGNSGGPLFNTDGEVIGINSQIYTSTGSYAGVSFAIPIDLAMDVVEQITENGKVTRGWLGVQIQEVTAALADSFGLKKPEGALVASVVPNSPAAKAKLKAGDIILKFNGQEVVTSSQLPVLVSRVRGDETVEVEILRDNKRQNLKVKIEILDDDSKLAVSRGGESATDNALGIVVENIADDRADKDKGVIVTSVSVDGLGQQAGVRRGDIISQINGMDVEDIDTFIEAMDKARDERALRLLVKRNGNPYFMAIRKPQLEQDRIEKEKPESKDEAKAKREKSDKEKKAKEKVEEQKELKDQDASDHSEEKESEEEDKE